MATARIISGESVSDTAKWFTFELLSGVFSFRPGQYTSFLIRDQVRTYSLCSLPSELPRFNLCVRQVPGGAGTEFLNLNVGREVTVTEPDGDFLLPEGGTEVLPRICFLASGVGVAPVFPMIRHWLATHPAAELSLIYRLHDGTEYLFEKEFGALAAQYEKFRVLTLPGDPSQEEVTSFFSGQSKEKVAYLVGPPGFVARQLKLFENLGYNRQAIRVDIWE